MTWKPNSWRNYPVVQMPTYPDVSKVNSVEAKLSFKPPLVFAGEVQALKKSLALAEKGNACLLYTSPSPRDVRSSRMPSSA